MRRNLHGPASRAERAPVRAAARDRAHAPNHRVRRTTRERGRPVGRSSARPSGRATIKSRLAVAAEGGVAVAVRALWLVYGQPGDHDNAASCTEDQAVAAQPRLRCDFVLCLFGHL